MRVGISTPRGTVNQDVASGTGPATSGSAPAAVRAPRPSFDPSIPERLASPGRNTWRRSRGPFLRPGHRVGVPTAAVGWPSAWAGDDAPRCCNRDCHSTAAMTRNWPLRSATSGIEPRHIKCARVRAIQVIHRENCQSRGRGFKSRRARHQSQKQNTGLHHAPRFVSSALRAPVSK
jgi:hypothetical protein